MDIKQLKLNGVPFYPKVGVDSIVNADGTASAVDTVVTQGSQNLVTSDAVYDAIGGVPTPAEQVQSDWNQTNANAVDYIKNKPVIPVVPTLATVATTGSYNDLLDKPSIPAAQVQSDWTQSDTTAVDYIKHKPFNDIRNFVTDDGNHPSLKGDATDYISFTGANGISTSHPTEDYIVIDGSALQPTLVSGTNIKTIDNQSILGSGNITISGSTGRQVISYISSDSTIDQSPFYSLEIPFTDDAFTIKVTAIDCSSTGDRLTSTTNVYTVFAKRYDDFAMRIINRDGDNKDVIKTAISLANSTVTYEGSYGTGNDKWYLPILITSSLGLKAVMIEIIGAVVNGAPATINNYPGLTYPNTYWKNDELNNLMA